MDVWQIALYAGAALLALRSLAALMTDHRQKFRERLLAEEEQRLRAERARARKTQARNPQKPTRPNAAA